MDEDSKVSLGEQDYLDILGLIEKFNDCECRSDLNTAIKNHLLPMFQASTCLYGWSNNDISSIDVTETINMPEEMNGAVIKEFIAYDPLSALLAQSSRPVMAHDVDVPREKLHQGFGRFLHEKPEFKDNAKGFFDKYKTALVAMDKPASSLGMGIHRLSPNNQPFERKDIRRMELIRPHLLSKIKSIILSEELGLYKSLTQETLGTSKVAIALVKLDTRIIYHNAAFKNILDLSDGQKLPEELAILLNQEISSFESPIDTGHSKIKLPFYLYEGKSYRLSLSVLKGQDESQNYTLLIRLKPVVESYAKMNLLMQETGLTSREMEVCILIKDGITNQEISSRLFLSIHTVKNHVNSIYKKLNIHTRPQLVALLNREDNDE